MNDSVRENLLGLLLGALDDEERRELEEQLETNAELREEFAKLRDCVEPLDRCRVNYEPTFGLADRTFAHVQREVALQEQSSRTSEDPSGEPRSAGDAAMSPAKDIASSRQRSWSMADAVVVAGVLVGALALCIPALFASWESSRRTLCQNNLRQIGFALGDFAQQSPLQRLPVIEAKGNRSFAGVYAPILLDAGYLNQGRVILCPSSELARSEIQLRVPTLDQIDNSEGPDLIRLQRLAGGSYGYNLGYLEDTRYVSPSLRFQDPLYVWAADAPVWNISGRRSENHSGQGQNMLFADQHIRYVVGCIVRPNGDDAFRNDRGLVEAGVDRLDSVIGESQSRPFAVHAYLPQP